MWDLNRNCVKNNGWVKKSGFDAHEKDMRWLNHVVRMEASCITKCLLVCKPEGGKRVVGGQKRR